MPASVVLESASPQQPAPAGTRLIVRALTSAGEPVTDLKKEEITVRTDGKPREVKDLTMVRVSGEAPPAAAPPASPPTASSLPAPYATNAAAPAGPADSRQFLILLDEEGLAPGREEPIRSSLTQLISRLSPADRLGLLSLRIGGISIAPTGNHGSVKEAIGKIVGGGVGRETEADLACRTKRALDTVTNAFRDAPAGRTIVLVSSGMAPMKTQQTSDVCVIRTTDLEVLGAAAGGSAANIYVLYYGEGLANPSLISTAQQGLENVAGATNAQSIRLSGTSETAATRIARETSVYYIATLDGGAEGPTRRVDGRITREGVRAIVKPIGSRPVGGGAATSGKRPTLRDMVATTAAFTGVPLRAVGVLSRQGTSEMKLLTLFEPADPSMKLTGASVALVDGNTVKSQWTAKPEELGRSPVIAALPIASGRYRIRVAATTADAEGTVDFDLVAALLDASPLKIGGMMLGISSDKGFVPRLQFSAADKMVVGFAEVYGVPKGATLTAQFEVKESESAEPTGSAPGQVQNGPGEDARIVVGGFDIATLAPGDYIMRAIVSIDGKVAGTVTRTLRKVK